MQAFFITSRAHEPKLVLAEHCDHAMEIIAAWYALNGIHRAHFVINDLEAWQHELDIALSWGTSGFASHRPDGGFGIQAVRDDRTS